MSDQHKTHEPDAQQALRWMRVSWAVVIILQLVVLYFAIIRMFERGENNVPGKAGTEIGLACVIFTIVVLASHSLRNQTYKQYWQGHRVSVWGYVIGNIECFLCLISGFVLCVGVFAITRIPFPYAYLAGVLVFLQGRSYPTGGPMRDVQPRLGEPTD